MKQAACGNLLKPTILKSYFNHLDKKLFNIEPFNWFWILFCVLVAIFHNKPLVSVEVNCKSLKVICGIKEDS